MRDLSDLAYDLFMLPLETLLLNKKRKDIFKKISGNVLEIGVGTGTNLKYYDYGKLKSLTITDQELSPAIKNYKYPEQLNVRVLQADVQSLPFESGSMDSIVFTLVFCSVTDPYAGLKEIKRVLKPDGRIFFIEHVLPLHNPMREVFHKANHQWPKIAGGCNLSRETDKVIEESGFKIEKFERFFGAFITGVASIS
ncbi:MAG: Methyltransferase type 11 [Clostridiales bacterium 38_11]|nr:MAG: Methyltransferase type 11 [Clostridiales bacterium 38_11]